MLKKVATKCTKHSYDKMANVFGVQPNSLNKGVQRNKPEFTNDNNDEKCATSVKM